VWRLFVDEPCRWTVPAYVTINRALGDRSTAGHLATVQRAVAAGWHEVKCAPFHAVTRPGDQVAQAAAGLETLAALRTSFPGVALRVDCHERFDADPFLAVLPALDALGLAWIEAPCPIGAAYGRIRTASSTPIAAGELLFGRGPFREIVTNGWADIILPDVKHVGGFGPLLEVCELAGRSGVAVAPHNPSGPVATLASVQAAACSAAITCVEIALRRDGTAGESCDRDGALPLPDGPGWGAWEMRVPGRPDATPAERHELPMIGDER
jgi:galactonate dehydratase